MGKDYEQVAQALAAEMVFNTAAEVHGTICGQLCSTPGTVRPEATAALLGLEEAMTAGLRELFEEVSLSAARALESEEFAFQPLLPDDDEELSLRVHALGKWCDGFNVGFAAGCARRGEALEEETREVLKDFIRIAEIQDRVEEEDRSAEEQEEDYVEIVEYVRMAAATVYMQNNPASRSGDADGTTH